MPIYLVRWPGWVASLVSARDELERAGVLLPGGTLERRLLVKDHLQVVVFSCNNPGCAWNAYITQTGCRIQSQFVTGFGLVDLEATIGESGLVAGSLSRPQSGIDPAVSVAVEGNGVSARDIYGHTSASARFVLFTYHGGAIAGLGEIAIEGTSGSASRAFIDLPPNLID